MALTPGIQKAVALAILCSLVPSFCQGMLLHCKYTIMLKVCIVLLDILYIMASLIHQIIQFDTRRVDTTYM